MDMGDVLIIIITAMNKDRLDELYELYPLPMPREYRKNHELKKCQYSHYTHFKNILKT